MSQERIPGGPVNGKSELERIRHEKHIQSLFRRAGWGDKNTPEERRQVVREEFVKLFEQALFEKNSPYEIHESMSKDKTYSHIAITKNKKTIAIRSTLNMQQDGQPEKIYSVVKKTGPLRRNLVFQVKDYPVFGNIQKPSELNIGYYWGEGKARIILSDK